MNLVCERGLFAIQMQPKQTKFDYPTTVLHPGARELRAMQMTPLVRHFARKQEIYWRLWCATQITRSSAVSGLSMPHRPETRTSSFSSGIRVRASALFSSASSMACTTTLIAIRLCKARVFCVFRLRTPLCTVHLDDDGFAFCEQHFYNTFVYDNTHLSSMWCDTARSLRSLTQLSHLATTAEAAFDTFTTALLRNPGPIGRAGAG